jgi:hypothetical protein
MHLIGATAGFAGEYANFDQFHKAVIDAISGVDRGGGASKGASTNQDQAVRKTRRHDRRPERRPSLSGRDLGRAFAEFERFENYHRSKGTRFADWRAAWRTWCSNGAKFDRERAQHQGGTVIDEAGNTIQMQPPARQPYRQRSHLDLLSGEDER